MKSNDLIGAWRPCRGGQSPIGRSDNSISFPGNYAPAPIFQLIYPIDKGHMDILRLLHFFALAFAIRKVLAADVPDRWQHYFRPVLWCGEHPLAVYCASVLLSFAGHAFLRLAWNNLLTQALVTLGGIVIMTGIAAKLAHRNRSRGSPAPI